MLNPRLTDYWEYACPLYTFDLYEPKPGWWVSGWHAN